MCDMHTTTTGWVPPSADLDRYVIHHVLNMLVAPGMHVFSNLRPDAMRHRHRVRHGHVATSLCTVNHYH